jgi:predicted DCC family thiol-disulfide oxidoreductase YuxK
MGNGTDISLPNSSVLFFDGECNLCNSSVQFIIRRDKKKRFLFAPLQSAIGQKALNAIPGKPDSLVLYHNGRFMIKSDAALNVARMLGGIWPIFYTGIILPRFMRDGIYDYISRHRYKWFGKQAECMIPTPELKSRFLS